MENMTPRERITIQIKAMTDKIANGKLTKKEVKGVRETISMMEFQLKALDYQESFKGNKS